MSWLLWAALGLGGAWAWDKTHPSPPALKPLEGPLRPEPPAGTTHVPGPAAARLGAFIDRLTDNELALLRSALPPGWWEYVAAAVYAPDDAMFRFTLEPMQVDFAVMPTLRKIQLQNDIVGAIGVLKARELQGILKRAGVIK